MIRIISEPFFTAQRRFLAEKIMPVFDTHPFDELAEKASGEKDLRRRKALVFHMQALIAREIPCIPLYTGPRVEAARNDHFKGWIKMPGGIGNLWSFVHLKPTLPDGGDKK